MKFPVELHTVDRCVTKTSTSRIRRHVACWSVYITHCWSNGGHFYTKCTYVDNSLHFPAVCLYKTAWRWTG